MAVYRDRIVFEEVDQLIAYRGGSLEVNALRARVEGARICKDGCWAIVSQQGEIDRSRIDELLKQLESGLGDCGGLADAKLFRGSVELGRGEVDLESLIKVE